MIFSKDVIGVGSPPLPAPLEAVAAKASFPRASRALAAASLTLSLASPDLSSTAGVNDAMQSCTAARSSASTKLTNGCITARAAKETWKLELLRAGLRARTISWGAVTHPLNTVSSAWICRKVLTFASASVRSGWWRSCQRSLGANVEREATHLL